MSIGRKVALNIEVRGEAVREKLGRFYDAITDRTDLHHYMGERARELTRNYLIEIAQTRHATATRLGAAPSGHWAQAAEKTTVTSDSDGATVTIKQPGIGRVAHDVVIKPGAGKKYLTIAAIAEAYNRRAYRLTNLALMFRVKDGQRRPVALVERKASEIKYGRLKKDGSRSVTHTASRIGRVWYWLVKSVRQKQDRSLLPSDEKYRLSALAGVRDYVDRLIAA
jgi:hypothetical protein